ncbi:MAG: hypothetical protein A4E28_02346 [Methanocella sp. PtaU1.Bin125]|nr:MAG: hypothetical protein A4E28_02346 [Methanocella sp. PtaU1.Bin125]
MSDAKPGAAVVLVFLVGVSMGWLAPADAQAPSPVIHENPASLTSQQPFDVNAKLMLQLEQMFGSLDSMASGLNASDFDASRLSMGDYDLYYGFFKDYLNRTGVPDSDFRRFVSQADLTACELRDMINSSEAFSEGMARFEQYYAAGDTVNATLAAAGLQKHYDVMNGTNRNLTAGAAVIGLMLQNTGVNMNRLDAGISRLNAFMERVDEVNRLPLQMLGDTSLTLNASQAAAGTGDTVTFAGRLESDGTAVAGGLIALSVDGLPAGNAITGEDGSYTIFFTVPGDRFDAVMNAIAVYDPQGSGHAPAVSDSVELRRLPVNTYLSFAVVPQEACFGDVMRAEGRLTAEGGYPVPGHPVAIVIGDRPALYVNTSADGYYSCDFNVTPRTPAGLQDAFARFEAERVPGEALTSATSSPISVMVRQESTSLTLDAPPSALYGGQSATFSGALTGAHGQPVWHEEVAIYADDTLLGYNSTDEAGRYSIRLSVPYDLSPGYHRVYAKYGPGDGMALIGSSSGQYDVEFRSVRPDIETSGLPLLVFQGDTLNYTLRLTASGQPVSGRMLTASFSGAAIGNGMTDANGSVNIAYYIGGIAGLKTLSVSSEASGLLEAAAADALVPVMPLGLPASLAVVFILLLVAGLAFAVLTRADRRARWLIGGKKKPLPKPTLKVPPPSGQPEAQAGPSPVSRFEDEVARAEALIAEGSDPVAVISGIYAAARRMARGHGIALPDSATHREFFKTLTAREPSLTTAAGTITKYYEAAVFGRVPVSEREIASSLDSLRTIKKWADTAPAGDSA